MRNCLPTKTRLKKNHHKRGNYSEKCKYCKKTENTLHVFARCKIAAKIWKPYQPIYENLLPNILFFYGEAAISLNLIDTKITHNTRKLTLTLTNIIIHELWTSRNKFEKDSILPNIERIVKTINSKLKYIIEVQYKHYKNNNDIQTFTNLFTINDTICAIENDNLKLNLPDCKA